LLIGLVAFTVDYLFDDSTLREKIATWRSAVAGRARNGRPGGTDDFIDWRCGSSEMRFAKH